MEGGLEGVGGQEGVWGAGRSGGGQEGVEGDRKEWRETGRSGGGQEGVD